MTGDMEYGRGKRRHDKRDLSDDKCDGESICNISSMKKQVFQNLNSCVSLNGQHGKLHNVVSQITDPSDVCSCGFLY